MGYDNEFYVRREQQERAIAGCSINPAIAAIHIAMAERYAELALMPGSRRADEVRSSFPGRNAA